MWGGRMSYTALCCARCTDPAWCLVALHPQVRLARQRAKHAQRAQSPPSCSRTWARWCYKLGTRCGCWSPGAAAPPPQAPKLPSPPPAGPGRAALWPVSSRALLNNSLHAGGAQTLDVLAAHRRAASQVTTLSCGRWHPRAPGGAAKCFFIAPPHTCCAACTACAALCPPPPSHRGGHDVICRLAAQRVGRLLHMARARQTRDKIADLGVGIEQVPRLGSATCHKAGWAQKACTPHSHLCTLQCRVRGPKRAMQHPGAMQHPARPKLNYPQHLMPPHLQIKLPPQPTQPHAGLTHPTRWPKPPHPIPSTPPTGRR